MKEIKYRKTLLDIVIVLIISVVVISVFFGGVVSEPYDVALGAHDVDLPAQIWLLWWENHSLKDSLVNHPYGGVDFYVLTPIHSIASSVFYPDVILAHNLVTVLGVLLSIIAGACLGRHFGGHWSCVAVGGCFLPPRLR